MRLDRASLISVFLPMLAAPALTGDLERLPKSKIPKIKAPAAIAHRQTPLKIKVIAIHFNPWIAPEIHSPGDPKAKPKTIRELGAWNDPTILAPLKS